MPGHDIIVIGASAGGVEAITNLVRQLPKSLPAALFVTIHFPANSISILPKALNRASQLQALHAVDGGVIEHGHIYVAPPDHHLLVQQGHMRLGRGPKENRHRPAVDPLFRTAALAYGPRVVGVILSGTLDDGVAGLKAIKQCGGVAVVQEPQDALYEGMPRNAIENIDVDSIVPLRDMGAVLRELAQKSVTVQKEEPLPDRLRFESNIAEFELSAIHSENRPGNPSAFSCPECGGVLWELHDGEILHFRCRVGHAYSPDTLLAEQGSTVETALWMALRALEERAALMRRLAARATQGQLRLVADRFHEQLRESEQQATMLREVLLSQEQRIYTHHHEKHAPTNQSEPNVDHSREQ